MKKLAAVDRTVCVACGVCMKACPKGAISIFRGCYAMIGEEICVGCGLCAKACPANAIYKTDYTAPGKKLPSYQIDPVKCVKCGACMATCKLHAIVKK